MTHRAMTPFGDLLRQHRVAKGLTQEALAECAGLGVRTIKGIEQGAGHQPRADTLLRLIAALELSPDQETTLRDALRGGEPDNQDSAFGPLTQAATATTLMGAVPMTHRMTHLTPLIGREDFIRDTLATLSERTTRLLTLVGPPGVGKTRIGLEIAKRVASESVQSYDRVADRVESIALASVRQPSLVLPAIVQSVGILEVHGSAILDALADALCGTRTLLFLDNFEHLLDATTDILSLLIRCPDLKLLITSRAALRTRGEREVAVPPLAVPTLVNTLDSTGADMDPSVPTTRTDRMARMVATEQPSVYMPDTADMPVIAGGAILRKDGATGAAKAVMGLMEVPAFKLFVQRAQATGSDFTLNDDNALVVAEICRQVDGLPLALELAAARLRLFTPSELLARLANQLSTLADRAPDLPNRQQTMREAIAWSYVLLAPHEQWTFRQLGVCADGCSLGAAEAICGRDGHAPHVFDDLMTLAAHSLIQRVARADGASCIIMLEAIREYAQEQLDAHHERERAAQAHGAYFCSLVESIAAPTQAGGHGSFDLKVLDNDYANLQAALGWAIDHHDVALGERLVAGIWRYWYSRGLLTEGRRWSERLLALVGDTDQRWINGSPELAVFQGASGTSILDERSDRTDNAETGAAEGQYTGGPHTRSASLATALNGAGMLAFRQGDYAAAITLLRRSLALQRWRDDKRGSAAILNNLGIVAADQGQYLEAQTYHEESLAMKHELGNAHDIAVSLNNLGCVARAQGHDAQAAAFFEENLAIQRMLGDKYRIAHALGNLGTQAYVQSNYEQAQECYLECLALQREIGDRQGIALTLLNLGEVAKARGALGEAITQGYESLTIFRALGEPMRMVSALSLLASVSYALGDVPAARGYLREILDVSHKLTTHRALHQWAIVLAGLAHDDGQHHIAVQFLVAAELQRTEQGARWTSTEQQEYETSLEYSRNHMNAPAFQEAQDAASSWSWHDVVDNAGEYLARYDKFQHEEADA